MDFPLNLQTEFMVDMKCDGCVKSVRTKLEPLDGKMLILGCSYCSRPKMPTFPNHVR